MIPSNGFRVSPEVERAAVFQYMHGILKLPHQLNAA